MADVDDYIVEIANQVVTSDNNETNGVMLKLANYLETLADEKDINRVMETIWQKNLVPLMLIEMKRDYSNVLPRSWSNGTNICRSVSYVLSQTSKSEPEIKQHLLAFIENILYFCRQLQNAYAQALMPDNRGLMSANDLFRELQRSMEIIESFSKRFPTYLKIILQSAWFLQVFVTDTDDLSILMLDVMVNLVKTQPKLVGQIGKESVQGIGNIVFTIVDEIIYYLAISNNRKLAESAIKCMLELANSDSTLISTLNFRYKGLKILLLKWTLPTKKAVEAGVSKTFSSNLRKLINLLEQGSMHQANISINVWAVIKIQAWWRSASARFKLRRTNRAFSIFQRKYRSRKSREKKQEEIERVRKELEYQIFIARRKRYREKLESEIVLMEALPGKDVMRYLEKTRHEAAEKIQAFWKGFRDRKKLLDRKRLHRKVVAAVVIQKQVKAWLSRRDIAEQQSQLKSESDLNFWQIPGLTVERKEELFREHNRWLASHKHEFKGLSEEEQLQLYQKAQQDYRHHLYRVKPSRRQDLKRDALMAQIETDCNLLLNAPNNLNEAVEKLKNSDGNSTTADSCKLDHFVCRIRPIANRAVQLHQHKIRQLKMPWWKQLLLDEPDDLEADDDFLPEAGNLDQYLILRNRLELPKELSDHSL